MDNITRTCINNLAHTFSVSEKDAEFYQKMQVPAPTLCPDCRLQRRLAFRNERKLYNRKSDLSGKQIVSIYSPDKPFKVYTLEEWWGDSWDGVDFGRPFDFNRPFFEQFQELLAVVPRVPFFAKNNVNSDYTNGATANKDCYLIFVSDHCEAAYYSYGTFECRNVSDCLNSFQCELCYECIGCNSCYNSRYLNDCSTVRDSSFLLDCKNCNNCFASVGLRNKEYCILNQQYTKEEYLEKMSAFHFDNSQHIQKAWDLLNKQAEKHPRLFMHGVQNEESTGDYISNCKNSTNVYNSHYLEDCQNIIHGNKVKDVQEAYVVVDNTELCYEITSSITQTFCRFTYSCWDNQNLTYCDHVQNSHDLFGCAGLKRKQYCILNKQYSKEEYEQLVPKIIAHMKKEWPAMRSPLKSNNDNSASPSYAKASPFVKTTEDRSEGILRSGVEWGEYFPVTISPFGYNETVAQEIYPLTKEEALRLGMKWKDDDVSNRYEGPKVSIPDAIKDVTDEITKEILTCEKCQKNYRIVVQELQFYRAMQVPIPKMCFDCRHLNRLALTPPRKLYERNCQKCGVSIQTTYAPDRPEIVYCEKCYNDTIH